MNVIHFVIEALKETPWWVYALFIYLMFIGISALKTRTISIFKLFVIPTILTVGGLYSLIHNYKTLFDIAFWVFAFALGSIIGLLVSHKLRVTINKNNFLITLQGSSLTLILILIIFAAKYFFGYLYATHPLAHESITIFRASLCVSGIVTGIFMGRVIYILKKFMEKHS